MVIVLVALSLTLLFVIAALVIDLSIVRQNRQAGKSAADLAAAAGIRQLDNGSGSVQPWKGICAARNFLLANNDELAGMTETFTDGTGAAVSGSCASPPATICAAAPTTWGVLTGRADGGRVRVTIRNGYALPDPAFPEDAATYSTDAGSGPCDHLAVIIEEGEGAFFGGVAGASGYESVVRSVARLEQGSSGDVAPALLMLERTDCEVLLIGGGSGATVRAAALGQAPGVIHSDSLGNGSFCDADPEDGNIFQVDSNPTSPRIIVERATAPVGSEAPGLLSAVALTAAPGAVAGVVSSPSPEEVCVQAAASHCGTTPPPISGGALSGRDLVGRAPVDVRYRSPVRSLVQAADSAPEWTPPVSGFRVIGCNDPIPTGEPRIWVECGENQPFDGAGKTFGTDVEEVWINGYVTVGGTGQTLAFSHVDRLYIRGRTDEDLAAIKLEGGAGNRIVVNGGSDPSAPCAASAGSVAETAKVVVSNGHVRVAGGGSGAPKVLRLCQTTVLMGDGADGDCPIPETDGLAPYDNPCVGRINVAGQATVDWTAPNTKPTSSPTAADLLNLEDLAFWTETQGSGVTEWGVLGNGGVRLAGVFFTPNADPFHVGGNGTYDIEDAQFITRRLQVRGNAALLLRPDPRNSVTVQLLGGFGLVR